MDRISFSVSSFEAYENDGMLGIILVRQQSTNLLHNISVRVRTRDLVTVDSAQGVISRSFNSVHFTPHLSLKKTSQSFHVSTILLMY